MRIALRESSDPISFFLFLMILMTSIATKSTVPTATAFQVAVIGGGAAGLACARVLSRNGLVPLVLEQDAETVGGVWNYNRQEKKKNRPMYRNLRTNLPREIMAYREKPWNSKTGPGTQSYVTHRDVLAYLEEYKNDFDLSRYIQYGATVTQLTVLPLSREQDEWPRIRLAWLQDSVEKQETFDAVCVCNGHYATPSSPVLPGLEEYFRGKKVLHSVEYDEPKQFEGQTVLCIGARASGSDLAREISHYAEHVYLSDSSTTKTETRDNVTRTPRTLRVQSDGSILFDCDCDVSPKVDTIIFCSGYDYAFPFISSPEESGLSDWSVSPGERRVMLLFKQLWHARNLSLAFLGLPHSVVPFPLFELQAEAVVAQLLRKRDGMESSLAPLQQRLEEAQQDATAGGYKGEGRVQDTHYLGSGQWDYSRELARLAEKYDAEVENYIATNQAIYDHCGNERKNCFPGGPDTYRETCYDRDDARQSFRLIKNGGSLASIEAPT